ncbi:hypothetical protein ASZ78_011183 [Callipepla squamata]|uniref:Uncharacterized protein n=1 Tax=Callipepla squamata TaxID=9009 RepID=A0A226MWK7_CALSU|nr:hypothetical protein ASZ78_011183 [Callipepla squamata]
MKILDYGFRVGRLLAVLVASLLLLCILLHYQAFHFYVAQAYAHLGYPHAQHIMGQRYLQGAGVEKNEKLAMHWFRQAAGQGHPHSSFNLALGVLSNMTVALEEGQHIYESKDNNVNQNKHGQNVQGSTKPVLQSLDMGSRRGKCHLQLSGGQLQTGSSPAPLPTSPGEKEESKQGASWSSET